jgi:glycosyltransferase involved in cell wall biosynthesis
MFLLLIYMINGIIYQNMACIEYIPRKYKFFINWIDDFDSKEISIKCKITTQEFFYKKIEEIFQLQIKKLSKELSYSPKISIILSVYQGEKTIKNSIRSIINQNYKNIELVIINDASTDKTEEIILKFTKKYNNIKYIKNIENKGTYFSRNIGIKESIGDFITIQDADDISDNYRIYKSLIYIIDNNFEFILTNGQYINELVDSLIPVRVAMATFLCRKDFFENYGFYDENTRHSADLELLDRAYFKKYGEYKFDNFWYWLNYTHSFDNFYGHIYENLYYIGIDNLNRISNQNKIIERLKYLNNRREEFR